MGDGSSPRMSGSPVLDEAERLRGVHPHRLEHLGGQHLAHSPPLSVSLPSPPRDHGVRPLPLVPRSSRRSRSSCSWAKRKRAAVAELRVVHVELVTVVAQRQRLRQVAGERLEAGEVRLPLGVGERVETDGGGVSLVAEAEHTPGERGRRDLVGEAFAELLDVRRGAVAIGRGASGAAFAQGSKVRDDDEDSGAARATSACAMPTSSARRDARRAPGATIGAAGAPLARAKSESEPTLPDADRTPDRAAGRRTCAFVHRWRGRVARRLRTPGAEDVTRSHERRPALLELRPRPRRP